MENVFWKEVDKALAVKGERRPWLSEKSGVSLGRINNWYVRNTLPRVDDAVKIADALEVQVRQLVTGEEKMILESLPDTVQQMVKTYTSLSERHRAQMQTICRAAMALIHQGILDIPVDAYFRMMEPEGRKLS